MDFCVTTRCFVTPLNVDFSSRHRILSELFFINIIVATTRSIEGGRNEKIGVSEREAAILQFNSVQVAASTTSRSHQCSFCIRFDMVECPPVLDFDVARSFISGPVHMYAGNSFRETSTMV